jgi:hypothetical protein
MIPPWRDASFFPRMIQHAGEQISARTSPGIRMAFFRLPACDESSFRKKTERATQLRQKISGRLSHRNYMHFVMKSRGPPEDLLAPAVYAKERLEVTNAILSALRKGRKITSDL